MLALDDPKWKSLKGGYRLPYDASIALQTLQSTSDREPVWEELWNELYHQGDVGEASYAAVPHLVRICKDGGLLEWNMYSLVSWIEIERHTEKNPPLPAWTEESYKQAWKELLDLAYRDLIKAEDEITVRCIFGTIALGKGLIKLGHTLSLLDAAEIEDIFNGFCAGK